MAQNKNSFIQQPDLVEPVSVFMSHVHTSVNNMSAVYLQNERRYNYTTPKTFLEQIALYGKLLNEKTKDLKMTIVRLENGLEKLASCAGDVAVLKVRYCIFPVLYSESTPKSREFTSGERPFLALELLVHERSER